MPKILLGHTSPETAYVVDDYPYGFRLRCKIRYWVEEIKSGQYKGRTRLMSQTTNPKISGAEVWNKPKGETSNSLTIMYLDDEGHVQSYGLSVLGWPEWFARLRQAFPELPPEVAKKVEAFEKVSRKYSPQSWKEWDEKSPEERALAVSR